MPGRDKFRSHCSLYQLKCGRIRHSNLIKHENCTNENETDIENTPIIIGDGTNCAIHISSTPPDKKQFKHVVAK